MGCGGKYDRYIAGCVPKGDADVIYFQIQSVYSHDISKPSKRDFILNKQVDSFLNSKDELNIRVRYVVPWGKMVRKSLVDRFQLRFDEVRYANDIYFSVCVGIYAKSVDADRSILYNVTEREGSLSFGLFSGKFSPDELEVRTSVSFRAQMLLRENGIYVTPLLMRSCLLLTLRYDRFLYKKYFKKIMSFYPSKISAIRDLSHGLDFYKKAAVYFYTLLFC